MPYFELLVDVFLKSDITIFIIFKVRLQARIHGKNLRKELPILPGIARQTLKVSLIHSRFYYFHLTLRVYDTLL